LKILLIGAGSIGKRHLYNLIALGYNDISVVTRSALPDDLRLLPIYKTVAEALTKNLFDTAFICTPTSLHITSLIELLQNKVENIYIEKPLSNSIGNVDGAVKAASTYQNNIVVGYDLHFDPGIQKVRELLRQNIFGKIVSINAFVGQYLPHWRPYEDHRKGMSARKETGGGVLLDIVHEFDYLCWLNGHVETVAGFYTNSGALEIETEEVAEVLLKFKNGSIGSVHLDYLQPSLVRHFIITGTLGSITCNLAEKKLHWSTIDNNSGEFTYTAFERNDRFKEIVRTFLENKTDSRLTSLQNALQSLYIVEAAKYASDNSCMVKLEQLKN